MSASFNCRICGNDQGNRELTVREMMFGTKQEFTYVKCASCATLQAARIPNNLSDFYPSDYLGFQDKVVAADVRVNGIRKFLRQQRVIHVLYGGSWLGWLASKIGKDYFDYTWEWFRKGRVTPNSRILDVGCGRGYLLKSLQNQGFSNLSGVDPFQNKTLPNLSIHSCQLNALTGQYDFIMSHHSLEHMPDPAEALSEFKRLCSPGGKILVRVPVADCQAWDQYGVEWFQIDAPRHLVIPSVRGMEILAERAGLRLDEIVYDSSELQFCCSEQYQQEIPLMEPRSYFRNRKTDLFTQTQIDSFKQQANELNKAGRGDQACFYFTNT